MTSYTTLVNATCMWNCPCTLLWDVDACTHMPSGKVIRVILAFIILKFRYVDYLSFNQNNCEKNENYINVSIFLFSKTECQTYWNFAHCGYYFFSYYYPLCMLVCFCMWIYKSIFSLFIDIIGGLHIIYISIFVNFVFLGNQITK